MNSKHTFIIFSIRNHSIVVLVQPGTGLEGVVPQRVPISTYADTWFCMPNANCSFVKLQQSLRRFDLAKTHHFYKEPLDNKDVASLQNTLSDTLFSALCSG